MENLADPRTDLRGLRPRPRPGRRRGGAGRRGAGRRCSATSTRRSARSPTSRRELQESIETGPAALDAGIERLPGPAAVPAPTARLLFRELRPGIRALRNAAPDLAARVRGGPAGRCAARSRSTSALEPDVPRAAGVRRGPADVARHQRPAHRRRRSSTRRSPTSRRSRRSATTRRSGSATSPRCCPRATTTAPGSGSSSSPRRRARTTRAARPTGPANGGRRPTDRPNFLHSNPYPNTPGGGAHERVRGRQRAVAQGPRRRRQRPGQPGHGHRADEDRPRQRGQPAVAARDRRRSRPGGGD